MADMNYVVQNLHIYIRLMPSATTVGIFVSAVRLTSHLLLSLIKAILMITAVINYSFSFQFVIFDRVFQFSLLFVLPITFCQ